jgi:hypothetical protein
MNKKWLGAGLLACAVAASAIAMKEPGMAIDASARKAAVAALSAQLRAHHAARALGEQAAAHIAQRERAGIYAGVTDRKALAAALNRDLPPQAGVVVEYAAPPRWPGPGTVRMETYRAEIGYLAVSRFDAAALAAPQYERALHQLRHARSIIIDLRDNPGGDAEAMRILASYFVDRPLRLSDVHAPGQPTAQVWTERTLRAKPHLGQVTILVNHGTKAEAEEFAYAMQRLKRGQLIGETTAGLAWRGAAWGLDEHLVARIPAAFASAPDSNANWQGEGVRPDIAKPAGEALRFAHTAILMDRLAHATTPMAKIELRKMFDEL